MLDYKMRVISIILFLLFPILSFGQLRILSKNKTLVYSAQYRDSNNNIVLMDTIRFETTGEPWTYAPERQISVYWEYSNLITDSLTKSKIKSINWSSSEETGAIDNAQTYWLHPPRTNQYSITEIAPFPDIEYPCFINRKYNRILNIGQGWGEWSNLRLQFEYEVVDTAIYNIGQKKYKCWVVESYSESSLGKSYNTTLFNDNFGFAKFLYRFYNKIEIEIKLVRIIEKYK